MNIKIARSEQEKKDAILVRRNVFIKEQNVPPELEIDEHELDAVHFIGYNDKNEPIAASRLRWINGLGKLERICVLKQHRGKSYGKQMIVKMESVIKQNGLTKAMLHSQTHAKEFYEQLGYVVNSKQFMDAGIPHVKMEKNL